MNRRLFVRRLAMAIVAPVASLVAAKKLTPEPDYTMTWGTMDGPPVGRVRFTKMEDWSSSADAERLLNYYREKEAEVLAMHAKAPYILFNSGDIRSVRGFDWDLSQMPLPSMVGPAYDQDLRFLRGKQWTAAEVAARGPVVASDKDTGIAIRFVKQYDIKTDYKPVRMDWEYDSVSNEVVPTRVVSPDADGVLRPNCRPGERLVVSGGRAHVFPALTPDPPIWKLIEAHIDGVYADDVELKRLNNLFDAWKSPYLPIKE